MFYICTAPGTAGAGSGACGWSHHSDINNETHTGGFLPGGDSPGFARELFAGSRQGAAAWWGGWGRVPAAGLSTARHHRAAWHMWLHY